MKKKMVILSLILAGCVLVTISDNSNVFGAEVITLKACGAWPQTSLFAPGFFKFFDIVKKNSNGRIQIKWVGGPEFIKVKDLPRAAAAGTVDVLHTAPGYLAGDVPEGAMCDYPLYRSFRTEADTYYELMKILTPLYEKKLQIKPLAAIQISPHYLWTKKQVTKMKDLKGLKIRAHGGIEPFIVRELGAGTITTPPTDVYAALERGIIDGAVRNIPAVNSFREYEVCHYAVNIPVTWTAGGAMISLRAWNKLPKDLQDVLWESGKELTEVSVEYWENLDKKLREKFPEQKITFFDPPEDMQKAWMGAIERGANKAALELSPDYGQKMIAAIERVYKRSLKSGH
jgi:TRAP-type C4-dicarboxylate transport system substrate-binding protein